MNKFRAAVYAAWTAAGLTLAIGIVCAADLPPWASYGVSLTLGILFGSLVIRTILDTWE